MIRFERWLTLTMVLLAGGYHFYRHDESNAIFFLLLAIWMELQSRRAA